MPGAFSGHSRFSYGICNENTFCYHFEQVTRLIQAFIPVSVHSMSPYVVKSTQKLQAGHGNVEVEKSSFLVIVTDTSRAGPQHG